MDAAALEPMPGPGRPKKYGDEKTEPLSVRLPESVLNYLGTSSTDRRSAAQEVLFFEKELSEELEDVLQELRVSSALADLSYEHDRGRAIARLVKLGLLCEKKLKK